VVLDLLGRFTPEWPIYWNASSDAEKVRPYSMSYLFSPHERRGREIEKFPLRFWSGDEVRTLCSEISRDAAVPLPATLLHPLAYYPSQGQTGDPPGAFYDYLRYLWVADGRRGWDAFGEPTYTTKEAWAAFIASRRLQRYG
jgi:hypothetical protein